MRAASQTAGKSATKGSEGSFRKLERRLLPRLSATALVVRAARALWPTKPDFALASKTGASDRMCRYWLENKYSLSADHLASLLRSDEGFKILEAIISESKPVWWRDFRRTVKRAELRRQQADLQKAIEDNEQGDLGL